jgi:4-aminobutyrate aminotransferase-like enzyme
MADRSKKIRRTSASSPRRLRSRTAQTLALVSQFESRNVTFLDPDGTWPIVWERAKGVHVWDAEGRRYLDLTAAFGVATTGHANSAVVRAGQRQMARLLHAMGDVHPHALKAELARQLSRLTFDRWTRGRSAQHAKTIFCNSGFEAVEAALKTARLATQRSGIIAFSGAYHGLGYGALNATHRGFFRDPFRAQLREFGRFARFPTSNVDLKITARELADAFRCGEIGAVLVEPVQARGGINVPPPEFLPLLRKLCDTHGALLITDEIYTGFGRTGRWFACEHSRTAPDLICLGKAMTGGFPLSACVGRAAVMDAAWPPSAGEAIHTSTFLGHPVGCAMALAQIRELAQRKLPAHAATNGLRALRLLRKLKFPPHLRGSARGIGWMLGVELTLADGSPATAASLAVIKAILHRGFVLLPEGEHANVISFTPPLTLELRDFERVVTALQIEINRVSPA